MVGGCVGGFDVSGCFVGRRVRFGGTQVSWGCADLCSGFLRLVVFWVLLFLLFGFHGCFRFVWVVVMRFARRGLRFRFGGFRAFGSGFWFGGELVSGFVLWWL